MNIFQSSIFGWSIAVIVLIPLLIVLLNEIIDRLRRRNNPVAEIFALLRDVALPLMAVVMVLRFLFRVQETNLPTRLVSTVFWSLLIVIVFRFSRSVLGKGEYEESDWRASIPSMFLRLPPYLIIGYIAFHIVQNVWSLPVSEMATTLGLGSVVVAFALQDTLSNLVSGLLLLANSPFKTGEWIHVGDVEGSVVDVNWRYTSIETRNGDLVVIPNGSISQESIENHSRPYLRTRIVQDIDVAFSNPPNKVKHMFMQTMLETPGVLHEPAPNVATTRIDDPLMGYQVQYWISDFADKPKIHNNFMTRVWYAVQRYDIALPSPAFDLYNYDAEKVNADSEITSEVRTGYLESLDAFDILPEAVLKKLGKVSAYKHYAVGETVVEADMAEPGIIVIYTGNIRLMMHDEEGVRHELDQLGAGEFFCENGLFGRPISTVEAVTVSDAEVLVIPHTEMNSVINRNQRFSAEVNSLITQRRIAESRILEHREIKTSVEDLPDPQTTFSTNGKGEH